MLTENKDEILNENAGKPTFWALENWKNWNFLSFLPSFCHYFREHSDFGQFWRFIGWKQERKYRLVLISKA